MWVSKSPMKDLHGFMVRACPFCGRLDTVDFANLQKEEDCACFEDEDRCPAFEPCGVCNGSYVICNVQLGGCGGSGGFAWNKEQAVRRWNRRPGGDDDDDRK